MSIIYYDEYLHMHVHHHKSEHPMVCTDNPVYIVGLYLYHTDGHTTVPLVCVILWLFLLPLEIIQENWACIDKGVVHMTTVKGQHKQKLLSSESWKSVIPRSLISSVGVLATSLLLVNNRLRNYRLWLSLGSYFYTRFDLLKYLSERYIYSSKGQLCLMCRGTPEV